MEIKDLAGISEPLKRLVEVIAEGVGSVSRPYLIKRNADAKAYEIRVISQAMAESSILLSGTEYEDGKIKILPPSQGSVEQLSLPNRAENRQAYQELRKQQNIESICANSAQELIDGSKVSEDKPESDWINRFFEIAENISTEDLQYLWGKILAGEIQKPGSFSLRTLETLRNMSRQEAENFCRLGQYIFRHKDMALYLNPSSSFFEQESTSDLVNFFALKDAGIISSNTLSAFPFEPSSAGDISQLIYGDRVLLYEYDEDGNNMEVLTEIHEDSGFREVQNSSMYRTYSCNIGILTKAGSELLKLVSIQPDIEYIEYIEYIVKILQFRGMKVAWAPIVKEEGDSICIGDKIYF
jgi:Protein of unknown function (DUF2806)